MEHWGRTAAGEDVVRLKLSAGGLTAHVISWGAVIQDLRLAGHAPPLVLGFERFEPYPAESPYFGATAGRVGNRIAGSMFDLDGKTYRLPANEGPNHLHGGPIGLGTRNWNMVDRDGQSVTLQIVSPDGEMGYPGTMTARCRYELLEPATLRVTLSAETDAPTLCNLIHHSYFNLDGSADVRGHSLSLDAARRTAVDSALIPTGKTVEVAGTPHDFRMARRIADGGIKYDDNYCLADAPRDLANVATLSAGDLAMHVATTEPGIQFYDGAKIAVTSPGLEGRSYGAYAGLCLEPQRWPDAIHHAGFPSIVLRPGETYTQVSEFSFVRT